MIYKRPNKLILLSLVLLILFISIPSCITAKENATNLESETDLIKVDSQDSETIETTTESDNDITSNDYYFDINNGDDNGNGTKDNPYKTITKERVKDNSVIHLANGEYEHTLLNSHRNISIYGEDATKTIINGNGGTLTINENFVLMNVTLFNLKIRNNAKLQAYNTIFSHSTNTRGGAINSAGYDVYLNNCSFENCYAQYGGAIYLTNSNLEIIDSQFINNTAYNYGGAIVLENEASKIKNITIQRTQFINDSSVNDAGGAIYLKYARINANYVNFTSCNATFGGAITSLKTDTQLNNFILNNNSAKYDGGAIYQIYGELLINNSNLSNNKAINGGAIYFILSENTTITNTNFNNNQANGKGKSIYSIANQNTTINNNTYNNNIITTNEELYEITDIIRLIYSSNQTLYHVNITDMELPAKYDMREEGLVTPVKNQVDGGNCWAFNTIGAIESSILKASGETLDLSEENMKNLMALYSIYGWNMETNKGGYDNMAVGYLVSWLGPINEIDDEYNDFSTLSPLLNSILHIQNIAFINRNSYTDNDAIKQAIMKYGAVATSMYHSYTYSNGNSYYYNGNSGSNHAVLIVGWDDNYSKSKFKNIPAGDGAWIVKNSWGTGWGENGYFYVSYYDTKFAQINQPEVSYVIILNDTLKYDKNYQYDIPGKTDYFLNSTNTAWYKNIFNSTDNEYLAAVSTYFQKDTNWTLTIKVNEVLKYTQIGSSNTGYYTINLNQMIPLNIGDIFEVIFKITGDGETGIPISEKVSLNNYFYKENISFLSYDGNNWTDLYQLNWTYPGHTYNSQVACIKAFTILNQVNTTLKIELQNIIENNFNLIASAYNQYGYIVNSGNITFTIGDNTQTIPVINGIAQLNVVIPDDILNINAEFNAIGYQTSTVSESIERPMTKLTLTISSNHNPTNISAYVTDLEGNAINTGIVRFNIEDNNYTANVINGFAKLNNIFLKSGKNNILAIFIDQNYNYKTSRNNTSIDIIFIPSKLELIINSDKNPYTIIANVTDLDDKPINSGFITFTISNINYTINIVNGIANITHTFMAGINNILATYNDNLINTTYNQSSSAKEINVPKTKVNMTLNKILNKNDVTLDISVNETSDYEILVYINNKEYTAISSNGHKIVQLKDLDEGNYKYNITLNSQNYEADTLTGEFNINTTKTKIIASDTLIYKNKEYSITLKDKNDIPISNREIILKIGDKTYKTLTNSQGVATFNLNLDTNTYYASIEFLGDETYLSSKANVIITIKNDETSTETQSNTNTPTKETKTKQIIVAPNLKVKKSAKVLKIKVKLKKLNNKILKNKKVKLRFKGKTYTAKTNKKGIVTFKIPKKVLKKLKIGKTYKYTTKYGKYKIIRKITIKK